MDRYSDIKKINEEEARRIVDERKPKGMFYREYEEGYVGIDNTTGDAWVEVFNDLDTCKRWLVGEFEIGDLKE